jgi:hypothetical protein
MGAKPERSHVHCVELPLQEGVSDVFLKAELHLGETSFGQP